MLERRSPPLHHSSAKVEGGGRGFHFTLNLSHIMVVCGLLDLHPDVAQWNMRGDIAILRHAALKTTYFAPVPDLAPFEGKWESTDCQGTKSITCQVSGFEWWQPEVHCRGGTDGDATILVAPTAAETPPDVAATDPTITEEAAGYEDGESNAPSQVAADVPAVRRRGRPRKLIPHQCFSRPPLVATVSTAAAPLLTAFFSFQKKKKTPPFS
ncbi:hypothetical protein HPB47_007429 [Ixodes persulcatus]|uniref:Uncharacterized protein n=1 Tax=Ixodes persulcatus TaxID=34615 RepID=A0AC60P7D2_IXOPE|nr:hypothetical protein HPB47_007429 [Ixodes persulcatus]